MQLLALGLSGITFIYLIILLLIFNGRRIIKQVRLFIQPKVVCLRKAILKTFLSRLPAGQELCTQQKCKCFS